MPIERRTSQSLRSDGLAWELHSQIMAELLKMGGDENSIRRQLKDGGLAQDLAETIMQADSGVQAFPKVEMDMEVRPGNLTFHFQGNIAIKSDPNTWGDWGKQPSSKLGIYRPGPGSKSRLSGELAIQDKSWQVATPDILVRWAVANREHLFRHAVHAWTRCYTMGFPTLVKVSMISEGRHTGELKLEDKSLDGLHNFLPGDEILVCK